MKKQILLIAILFWGFNIFAQRHYYNYSNNEFHVNQNTKTINFIDSFALNLGIKQYQVKETYYSKKGKASYNLSETNFDKMGRKVKYLKFNDTNKSKIGFTYQYQFNEKNLCVYENSVFEGSGYQYFYEYNDSNKLNNYWVYNHKNELKWRYIYSYNTAGKLNEINTFNRKQKRTNQNIYTYYPNGELKQIQLKDKKGKTIRVWDYTCDATGKVVKKAQDTAKICTTKTYLPDGAIITTTQSYTWNGKPDKNIYITNAQNILLEHQYLTGINDELKYKTIYTYNLNGKLISSIYLYYFKGKLVYNTLKEFDNEGRITKDIVTDNYRKKENSKSNTYTYNSSGIITQKQEFKNGKLKKSSNFMYAYY